MQTFVQGVHHITLCPGRAQEDLDFFTQVLHCCYSFYMVNRPFQLSQYIVCYDHFLDVISPGMLVNIGNQFICQTKV